MHMCHWQTMRDEFILYSINNIPYAAIQSHLVTVRNVFLSFYMYPCYYATKTCLSGQLIFLTCGCWG